MIDPKEYLENIEFPNYIIGEDRLKLPLNLKKRITSIIIYID